MSPPGKPNAKTYEYPNRWPNSGKRRIYKARNGDRIPVHEQDIGPWASQQKRIKRAVEEIANDQAASKKARIIELEQLAEEIFAVWEAMVRDLDHMELLHVTSRTR